MLRENEVLKTPDLKGGSKTCFETTPKKRGEKKMSIPDRPKATAFEHIAGVDVATAIMKLLIVKTMTTGRTVGELWAGTEIEIVAAEVANYAIVRACREVAIRKELKDRERDSFNKN